MLRVERLNKTGNIRIYVILRRVAVTAISVQKVNYYMSSVCFYGLTYPACKAHALYYIVTCDLSSGQYFSSLSHKGLDFRKIF
jgi:hypothetical protein